MKNKLILRSNHKSASTARIEIEVNELPSNDDDITLNFKKFKSPSGLWLIQMSENVKFYDDSVIVSTIYYADHDISSIVYDTNITVNQISSSYEYDENLSLTRKIECMSNFEVVLNDTYPDGSRHVNIRFR